MEDEQDSSSESGQDSANEPRGFSSYGIPLIGHGDEDEDESGDDEQQERKSPIETEEQVVDEEEEEEEDEPVFAIPSTGDMGDYHEEEEIDSSARVVEQCMKLFSSDDYIMEKEVFDTITAYFQAGSNAEEVVDLLSSNYVALAQHCNILAEWLVGLGVGVGDVQSIFEQHLQSLLAKHFDPKKADAIFHQQSESQIEWLPELIAFPPWRSLIYTLTEDHPDCLMLNFAIKLISDAGYQHEISSVSTAAQQLEIFSRVLTTGIEQSLSQDPDSPQYRTAVNDLSKVANHGEHTYLYTQSLLHVLSQEPKGGGAVRRLAQELRSAAGKSGHDTTPITLALHNSTTSCNPAILQAMQSMLTRRSLNPADITLLYNYYNNNEPPAVDLIRDEMFMDLLLEALFRPNSRLNPEHRPKYIFLLAYASSVTETFKKGQRKYHSRDDVKPTQQAIEKVHHIITEAVVTSELLVDLNTIFQSLRFPAAAGGVLCWVNSVVTEADYFKLHPEPIPIHMALLDEIVTLHPPLHSRVFALLDKLFTAENDGVDVLLQLERRRMLIDRFVLLLSTGYVLPVTHYFREKLVKQDTDISLIRYFVTETLEIIEPPYSADFVSAFSPLVENAEVAREKTLPDDKLEAIKTFIEEGKSSLRAAE